MYVNTMTNWTLVYIGTSCLYKLRAIINST